MSTKVKLILLERWRDSDGKVHDVDKKLSLDLELAENLILAGLARKS